jgi:hypothetical protein
MDAEAEKKTKCTYAIKYGDNANDSIHVHSCVPNRHGTGTGTVKHHTYYVC